MSTVVNPMTPARLMQLQVELLESFFDRDWLSSKASQKSSHPAVTRWLLARLVHANQGHLPTQPEILLQCLPDLARLLFDAHALSEISGGDRGKFSLGDFANYGDELVRRRIHQVKWAPISFVSLMTELAYGAWHQSNGYQVSAFDDEGLPDFRVDVADLPLPIIAECKYVFPDTAPNRYRKLIGKANSQIKRLKVDGYGVVVIDLSEKARLVRTNGGDDVVPEEIEWAAREVRRAMIDCNTSVSGAVLLWDDYHIMGLDNPGARLAAMIFLMRKSMFIPHKQPRYPLPETAVKLHPTYTLMLSVKRTSAA